MQDETERAVCEMEFNLLKNIINHTLFRHGQREFSIMQDSLSSIEHISNRPACSITANMDLHCI